MPSTFFTGVCLLALLAAAGCTTQTPRHEPPSSPQAESTALSPRPAPDATIQSTANGQALQTLANDTAVTRLLAYADRVRGLSAAELAPELTRLGDPHSPMEQMQLSLTLAQLRQTPELIRAQDLLSRVLANASPEAMAFHPLARLLTNRFGEQRRFEELLDKQAQQTRDAQRRLDQTTERLEALKAIERSLGSRAPTATPPARMTGAAPEKTVRPRSAP